MTQEKNIDFAKGLLVNSIYKSAILEGINVTCNQVEAILNDINVLSLTPKEIMKILGLKDAWNYLFGTVNYEVNLGYLETLHFFIAIADVPYYELGKIRTENVLISGTNWRPELPSVEKLHSELKEIMTIDDCTTKAVKLMLWIMRNQIFKDGNKRVATLAANKILIECGKGLLSVPIELTNTFKIKLVEFYETSDSTEIEKLIFENCISS